MVMTVLAKLDQSQLDFLTHSQSWFISKTGLNWFKLVCG